MVRSEGLEEGEEEMVDVAIHKRRRSSSSFGKSSSISSFFLLPSSFCLFGEEK